MNWIELGEAAHRHFFFFLNCQFRSFFDKGLKSDQKASQMSSLCSPALRARIGTVAQHVALHGRLTGKNMKHLEKMKPALFFYIKVFTYIYIWTDDQKIK